MSSRDSIDQTGDAHAEGSARPALEARLLDLEAELRALRRDLLYGQVETDVLPAGDVTLLRCRVGGDDYGISTDAVVEILRYVQVTRIADVSDVVAGAINVRGQVVAVIDARLRFRHAATPPCRGTAIVLTRVRGRLVGLIVDQVLDIVPIARGALSAPGGALSTAQGIAAIATLDRGVAQVIDLNHLLSGVQWEHVANAIESEIAAGGQGGEVGG
jgi:purine-binding chemotaxis protein CheW